MLHDLPLVSSTHNVTSLGQVYEGDKKSLVLFTAFFMEKPDPVSCTPVSSEAALALWRRWYSATGGTTGFLPAMKRVIPL